jgi:hypothetical protein
MIHKLLAFRAKNKIASVGSARNDCVTIGILQPSQHNMPRDFARYATVGEVEAELKQYPLYLENQFLHQWMCSFETADF